MESLAPPVKLILQLRFSIEKGESVRNAIQEYLQMNEDEFSIKISSCLILSSQGRSIDHILSSEKSSVRKGVLLLVQKGLKGEPIYTQLLALEQESIEQMNQEIESYLAVLPFKMMIPVLLFQFPAFLILLFGPLLKTFLSQIG
jgi:hypothetical protein